jgi:hypothetical protein
MKQIGIEDHGAVARYGMVIGRAFQKAPGSGNIRIEPREVSTFR